MPTSSKDTKQSSPPAGQGARKNVLLCFWKAENRYQAFSSLKHFTDNVAGYSTHTLKNYLSRKKESFEDEQLILTKVPFYPH